MGDLWQAIAGAALVVAGTALAIATWGALSPFAVPMIMTGVSLGSSWLAGQIAGEDAAVDKARTPTGISTEVMVGGAVPRQVAIGTVGIAGHLIYINTYGDDDDADAEATEKVHNKFLQLAFVLSDTRCAGLDHVWVDGKRKDLIGQTKPGGATEQDRYRVEDYGDKITVRFFDGRFNADADVELVNHARPAGRWSSAHIGAGVCYVSVTLEYDEKLFPTGIPQFLWRLRGALLYDPRKDDTAGGSGDHRFNNNSTWEYSDNPALALYHYRRGFMVNSQRLVGMEQPESYVHTPTYMQAADLCDENVSGESRYAISIIVSDDAQHQTNLDAIRQAMAGYEVEKAGVVHCIPGASRDPVAAITDDDLVVGEEVRYASKLPRDRLANAVYGQYLEQTEMFQTMAFKPVIDAGAETEDGEKLPVEIDLGMVPKARRARRIANIRLKELRVQGNASIVVGYHLAFLEAGDWITWNSDLYGTGKKWIVTAVTERTDHNIELQLRQTNDNVFGGAELPDEDYEEPVKQGGGNKRTTVHNFAAVSSTVVGSNGKKRTRIKATWTPTNDKRVDKVKLQVRKAGDTDPKDYIKHTDDDPEDGGTSLQFAFVPGAEYEARATIKTTPARDTTWTDWEAVTTTDDTDEAGGADTTPPDPPTFLSIDVTHVSLDEDGKSVADIIIDWTASPSSDVHQYELEWRRDTGGPGYKKSAQMVRQTQFTMRDVRQAKAYEFRIRAIDKSGNNSTWLPSSGYTSATSGKKTDNPPQVGGVFVTPSFKNLFVEWNRVTIPDLREYEIYYSADNATAPTTGSFGQFSNKGNKFTHSGMGVGVTRYYWVRAIDKTGNKGAWSSSGIGAGGTVGTTGKVEHTDTNTDNPNPPTSLSLDTTDVDITPDGKVQAGITATWTASSSSHIAGYEVEWKRTSSGKGDEKFVKGTKFTLHSARSGAVYDFRVRAVDKFDNRSAFLPSSGFTSITAGADSTAPAQTTGLTATATHKGVKLRWTKSAAADLDHYDILVNTVNTTLPTTATTETDQTRNTAYVHTGIERGDTLFYWVRAVDRSANKGAWTDSGVGTGRGLTATAGGVNTVDIVADAVDQSKLANDAVATNKLIASAVTNAKVGAQEITVA